MMESKFLIYQVGGRADLKIEEDNGRFNKYWINYPDYDRTYFDSYEDGSSVGNVMHYLQLNYEEQVRSNYRT
jgi:hypothetical protein